MQRLPDTGVVKLRVSTTAGEIGQTEDMHRMHW